MIFVVIHMPIQLIDNVNANVRLWIRGPSFELIIQFKWATFEGLF